MCRQAGSSPTIISSRSSKGSDYAEVPHGGWPENKVLANARGHNPGYGIMRHLVAKRRVVLVEARKQMRGRHRNPVGTRFVIGLTALVTKRDGDRTEEGIELGFAAFRLDQIERGGGIVTLGQAFDLVGVEHRIGLEHAARFI